MASISDEERRKKVVKGFKLPGRWSSSGKNIHDDPSLTPDDRIPPSSNPKTEFRRRSTPEMRRLMRAAALKAMKPINYFDNLVESVDEVRTGIVVKSRDALMSDIRSGKTKIPGGPGRVYVPHDVSTPIQVFMASQPEGAVVDVGNWARRSRVDRQFAERGFPEDKDGNYRPASVTIGGKTFGDTDEALHAAGVVARKNEIARKTYDVLKSTGVYSRETLAWAGKDRFGRNGVASEMTEAGREELYREGFGGLRARYRNLSGQKDLYQQRLEKAVGDYKGPRGFDDFVARNAQDFSYGKEFATYMQGVDKKIADAERAHNRSEVARLRQVAEGRRVQMQEMAHRKAMSAWSGSGAANLWRAQQELENTLANQQASAIRGMNAAMKSNAVLAGQLGVSVQSLLDENAPVADATFGAMVADRQNQQPPQNPTERNPTSPQENPVEQNPTNPQENPAAKDQTAAADRKRKNREPWEVA